MSSNDWEFIQSWLMRNGNYNTKVKNFFRDVDDSQDSLTSGRAANREACLIKDNDSALIALHRRFNYYFEVLESHLKPEVFAVPKDEPQILFANAPQISLHFFQDSDDVPEGKRAKEGEQSFRIINQKSNQISPSDIERYAQRIRTNFISSNGYLWRKGKNLYTYIEPERGYRLKTLAPSDEVAKHLVRALLEIQDHTPNWTYFRAVLNDSPNETYPSVTDKINILGELTNEPEQRPNCTVRFRYATIQLPPAKPRTLIDRTGKRANPLVEL